MKLSTRILSLLVLFGLATAYVSCDPGGGDDKTEEEKQLDKFRSAWRLESANDGTDRTTDFPNLVLTLSGTFVKEGVYNYSFTGTRPNPSPWPQSGTWKFGTPVSSQVIRDPGLSGSEIDMSYSFSNSDNTLSISFVVAPGSTGWAGGTSRQKSVTGNWTFVFTRQ